MGVAQVILLSGDTFYRKILICAAGSNDEDVKMQIRWLLTDFGNFRIFIFQIKIVLQTVGFGTTWFVPPILKFDFNILFWIVDCFLSKFSFK